MNEQKRSRFIQGVLLAAVLLAVTPGQSVLAQSEDEREIVVGDEDEELICGARFVTETHNKLCNEYVGQFGWKGKYNFYWGASTLSFLGYDKDTGTPKVLDLNQFKLLKEDEVFDFAETKIEKSASGYLESYSINLCVVPEYDGADIDENKVVGGFVTIEFGDYHYHLQAEEYRQIYYPLSAKEAEIEKDMLKILPKIYKKAFNELALLDNPGGIRMTATNQEKGKQLQKRGSEFFSQYSWNKYVKQFDIMYVLKQPWQSEKEIKEIKKVAEKTGFGTNLSIENRWDYYYSEHTFRVEKGSKDLFFLDFCFTISGDNSEELNPHYAWIVAKPAKKNAKGTLDRFIYPVNTSMAEIRKDMKAYLKK